MSKTFNLAIPFDFLLQAIAKLSPADKQRLWEFLDTDLHDSTDDTLDPGEEAEVAAAYAEYQAGEFVTLDEYTAQQAQHQSPEQVIFHQALASTGLVGPTQPSRMTTDNNFQPILVQGEAVSQTLLDERR